MKSNFWPFLLYLAVLSTDLMGSVEVRHIKLREGEHLQIEHPHSVFADLSKKGIVKVITSQPGHWDLIAIKPGQVLVSLYDDKSAQIPVDEIFIEVVSISSLEKVFCGEKQIQCAGNGRFFKGKTEAIEAFYFVKKACIAKRNCSFQAILKETARNEMNQNIRQALSHFDEIASTRVHPHGMLAVEVNCEAKLSDKRHAAIEKLASDYTGGIKPVIICSRKRISSRSFTLKAKVFVEHHSAIENSGIKSNFTIAAKIPSTSLISQGDAFFERKNSAAKIEVIAEPYLHLYPFSKGSLRSGGEFLTEKGFVGEFQKIQSWKKHGIYFEAKILDVGEEYLNVNYRLQLKLANQGHASRMGLHEMTGTSKLRLGQASLLAGVDIFLDKSDQTSYFFRSIPILGPLFKMNSTSNSKSKLYLQLKMSRHEVRVNVN